MDRMLVRSPSEDMGKGIHSILETTQGDFGVELRQETGTGESL